MLEGKTALNMLLASGGNLDLTCEVLGSAPGQPLPKHELVRALADDPATLQRSLRVFAMLKHYDLMDKTSAIVQGELENLKGFEAVKAYTQLSALLQEITATPTQTVQGGNTLVQMIFDSVPREAGAALKQLAKLGPEQLEAMRRQLAATSTVRAPTDIEDADYKAA